MQDSVRHLKPKKILIIQTAFLGDVILSTVLIEQLQSEFPDASIDFVLRKGNEGALQDHPLVDKLIVWDKNAGKYYHLYKTIQEIRKVSYDIVVNAQRFASTGLMTVLAKSRYSCGYKKNPLSRFFTFRVDHQIGDGTHEVDRLLSLTVELSDNIRGVRPNLYLTDTIMSSVSHFKQQNYIVVAPTSVWFTKQFPKNKWIEFIQRSAFEGTVYLIGGKSDFEYCETIRRACDREVVNLCGELSILQSAALMKDSHMNFVNDSAPLHMCSAINAPVTSIFCSTVPEFGFGPLSDNSKMVEVEEVLDCRPCGLHGHKSCPEGHFNCAEKIDVERILDRI